MTTILLRTAFLFGIIGSIHGELIDLSYSYDDHTLMWPGGEKFHFTQKRRGDDRGWYAANDYATSEHSGTHLDAPFHFYKPGRTVEQIPLEKLFAKGVIVNATIETDGKWNYALPASIFKKWEEENGPMPNKSVVLVSFGWGYKYPNKTEYMGPSDSDLRFPGLSEEAAHWLANNKKVVGVGLDAPSIDQSKNENAIVHRILCANDIYILENVALAARELPPIVDLVIMPMKLAGGSGAPARVVAKL